jgi:hypothetical protein
MMTMFRQTQTSYNATDFPVAGTSVDAHVVRDLSGFMDNPERRDTPFLNIISKGSAVNQIKHEWGLRGVTSRGSTVAGGGLAASAAATTLTVATGHGVRFQQGHSIRLEQAADMTSYEHVTVVSISGDALTVQREQGGTTALAFTTGDVAKIIGIALPELSIFPLGPVARGSLFYNYPQLFMTKVQVSIQKENIPDEENQGSWLNYDAAQRTGDLKLDLERALIYERRQLGSLDVVPNIASHMSGLLHFAELGGNVYDLDGANLELEHLEQTNSDLYDLVGSMQGKDLAMNNTTGRIFDRIIGLERLSTEKTTSANLTWKSVDFRYGSYTFTTYPDIPDGTIIVFNRKYQKYMPFKGMDWQSFDRGVKELGALIVERLISGQFTSQVDAPMTSAVITNFNDDVTAYPRLAG